MERANTHSSVYTRRPSLVWWRQVTDPAEVEWLQRVHRPSRGLRAVCAACAQPARFDESVHAWACGHCGQWLTPPCPQPCRLCERRRERPKRC